MVETGRNCHEATRRLPSALPAAVHAPPRLPPGGRRLHIDCRFIVSKALLALLAPTMALWVLTMWAAGSQLGLGCCCQRPNRRWPLGLPLCLLTGSYWRRRHRLRQCSERERGAAVPGSGSYGCTRAAGAVCKPRLAASQTAACRELPAAHRSGPALFPATARSYV